jgi:hypothetical protein
MRHISMSLLPKTYVMDRCLELQAKPDTTPERGRVQAVIGAGLVEGARSPLRPLALRRSPRAPNAHTVPL